MDPHESGFTGFEKIDKHLIAEIEERANRKRREKRNQWVGGVGGSLVVAILLGMGGLMLQSTQDTRTNKAFRKRHEDLAAHAPAELRLQAVEGRTYELESDVGELKTTTKRTDDNVVKLLVKLGVQPAK